jgi:hypothetical protein
MLTLEGSGILNKQRPILREVCGQLEQTELREMLASARPLDMALRHFSIDAPPGTMTELRDILGDLARGIPQVVPVLIHVETLAKCNISPSSAAEIGEGLNVSIARHEL